MFCAGVVKSEGTHPHDLSAGKLCGFANTIY